MALTRAARQTKRQDRKEDRSEKVAQIKTKIVKEAKQAGQQLKKTASNVAEKAQEVGKIVLLKPFAPVMKAALVAKKITPPQDLEKLARLFFNEVVKRDSFDEANTFNDGTNIMNATETRRDFDPITISALVSGILTWIQESRAKKAAGKELTKAQEAAVKTSDIINTEAEKAQVEIIKDEAGEAVFNVFTWLQKNWILLAVLLVGGFIVMRRR
jgi:hypothetical protein